MHTREIMQLVARCWRLTFLRATVPGRYLCGLRTPPMAPLGRLFLVRLFLLVGECLLLGIFVRGIECALGCDTSADMKGIHVLDILCAVSRADTVVETPPTHHLVTFEGYNRSCV